MMVGMSDDEVRPILRVIDDLRAMRGMSKREAARAAELSEGRWRQLVVGYQLNKGAKIAATAPDATVARMALAVGMKPADAERLGEPAISRLLREHLDTTMAASAPPSSVMPMRGDLSTVPDEDLLQELARRLGIASAAASVYRLHADSPPLGVAADDPGVPSSGHRVDEFFSQLGEESQE